MAEASQEKLIHDYYLPETPQDLKSATITSFLIFTAFVLLGLIASSLFM